MLQKSPLICRILAFINLQADKKIRTLSQIYMACDLCSSSEFPLKRPRCSA